MVKRSCSRFLVAPIVIAVASSTAVGLTTPSDQEIDRSRRAKYISATGELQNELWLKNYYLAQDLFQKGLLDFEKDKFEEAEKNFGEALGMLPEYADAILYVGLCRYKQGEYESALGYIYTAKEKHTELMRSFKKIRDDDLERIETRLAELQTWRADVAATMKRYESESATDTPSYQNLTNQLKFIDSEMNRLNRLKAEIVEQEDSAVPAQYYFHAGNCLLRLQRYVEAFDEYAKAIETDDGYGDAYSNSAVILFLAKRYEDAWVYLQTAKELGATVNPEFEKKLTEAIQQKISSDKEPK